MMEEPTPLVIGQAFVRQYYTLLNKAPDYLYRFYKGTSSYVHGGIDPNGKLTEAVYGQEEIHKKILSLQFSKCHTKIRHLEAHAVIHEGVLVQVLGELSNSGQPMRKFMQTFVLAPDDSVANKFYVHNDILRYKDEMFPDSDEDFLQPEATSEELKAEGERNVQEEIEEKAQEPVPEESQEAPKTLSWAVVCSKILPPIQRPPQPQREKRHGNGRSFPPQDPRPAQDDLSSVNKGVRDAEDMKKNPIGPYPNQHQIFVRNLPHDVERIELKKFFTKYGNVVDLQIKTRGFGGKVTTFGFVVFEDSDPVERILEAELQGPIIFRGHVHLSVEEKKTREVREHELHRSRMRSERDGVREGERGDMENRQRVVGHPNKHQLFVGNIPQDMDVKELKEFFMKYGNVLKLKINTRGEKTHNFGFLLFDNSDPVQRILEEKPIIFRGDVHLNVEERKTRSDRERERHSEGSGTTRYSRGPRPRRGP